MELKRGMNASFPDIKKDDVNLISQFESPFRTTPSIDIKHYLGRLVKLFRQNYQQKR